MSPEKQRIAIAEICGYEQRPDGYWRQVGMVGSCGIPDYLNSLDAMHEAEKVLTWKQHLSFRKHLWDFVIKLGPEDTWDRQFISASAAQRAEAFIKVFNKWEDGE